MVEIIAGTFGYFNGRKTVPITQADGPQTFDPELEERLIKRGIAKRVDGTKSSASEPVENAPEIPEYNASMKFDKLKEIAERYGLDVPVGTSKKGICDALDEYFSGEDEADDEQPDIKAATPLK